MNIPVLYSETPETAPQDEQDVLVQVEAVVDALSRIGHAPTAVPVDLNLAQLKRHLKQLKPDLVFNLVESLAGQDRLIHIVPSLLDAMHMPYTGVETEALFLSSNKLLAKKNLRANGIATPDWLTGDESHLEPKIQGTYIIKSVWDHASKGLDEKSVITDSNRTQLLREMTVRKKRLGGDCYAEAFIVGREFNLSMLTGSTGVDVLPPAEIKFGPDMPDGLQILGYRAKWDEDSDEYRSTTRCFDFEDADVPLLKNLTETALHCWRLFALRGYARVDFRVDRSGRPWVLEVNANPCLSPDAGFAAALRQAGLTFGRAIERIINEAMKA
ncbi:MAG: D-alanine--D-alanine ligase [Deltaproteobacteria bacterium]|nr:D-alanine--D-alanine ligase [Deltaproteobacteria bacterium]